MNTEGVPELDIDEINVTNKKYYDHAYRVLENVVEKYNISFEAIAIGLESSIKYSRDIKTMMRESDHVIVWLIKKGIK